MFFKIVPPPLPPQTTIKAPTWISPLSAHLASVLPRGAMYGIGASRVEGTL